MKTFPAGYHGKTAETLLGPRPRGVRRSFRGSLRFALRGIRIALTREPNLRRQALLGILVLLLATLLNLSRWEIALLMVVAGSVLILELLNSALEALCDAVHPAYHDKIRDAKDMAAAAVLVMSTVAAVVGVVILLPPLLEILNR